MRWVTRSWSPVAAWCLDNRRQNWALLAFGALHAFILLVLFRSGIYDNSALRGDIQRFYFYAQLLVGGYAPYTEFSVEYPPLALVFITLPRLALTLVAPQTYHPAFVVEILLFDLLGLFILTRLARRLGMNPTVTLAIYTVVLLAIGPMVIYRYDLIPAVLVLLSLYAFSAERFGLAWITLGVAVMTKIYPAVVAPVFFLYLFSRRRYRDVFLGAGVFAATMAVIALPGINISPAGFWESFSLQMQRGLHLDSTYSSFVMIGQGLGLTTAESLYVGPIPFSIDLVSPLSSTMVRIAPVIMVAALAAVYWLFFHRNRGHDGWVLRQRDMTDVAGYSFLAILVFIVTSSVFSPQFLIWLCPLVPLLTRRWDHDAWLILTMAALATYYIFPVHYYRLIIIDPQMTIPLLFRNLLLICLVFLLLERDRPGHRFMKKLTVN
jgi:uncharacterized membrane protein